jgi:hypothetical protein
MTFETAMLLAVGFIFVLTMGGFAGLIVVGVLELYVDGSHGDREVEYDAAFAGRGPYQCARLALATCGDPGD